MDNLELVLEVMVALTILSGLGQVVYKLKYFKASKRLEEGFFGRFVLGTIWLPLPTNVDDSKQLDGVVKKSNHLLYATYVLFLLTFCLFLFFGINMEMEKLQAPMD